MLRNKIHLIWLPYSENWRTVVACRDVVLVSKTCIVEVRKVYGTKPYFGIVPYFVQFFLSKSNRTVS